MGLHYENIDQEVRQAMVAEINSAIAADDYYKSKILTEQGRQAWPDLLRSAAISRDDDWLAVQLRGEGMLLPSTPTKRGPKTVNVGKDTIKLAEGQFNRYYMQAVCVVAMASDEENVQVYRARMSMEPSPRSEALIGQLLPALSVLTDLRQSHGFKTDLGFIRANSGISVRRV